jgi:hypothetical protein
LIQKEKIFLGHNPTYPLEGFEDAKGAIIDRPLNLPQYPSSNDYFSIPEENI